jgi:hypothetical protein
MGSMGAETRYVGAEASIPVAIVTSEASAWSMHDHGTADFLVQAGVPAVHLRLEDNGLHGNGHLMM